MFCLSPHTQLPTLPHEFIIAQLVLLNDSLAKEQDKQIALLENGATDVYSVMEQAYLHMSSLKEDQHRVELFAAATNLTQFDLTSLKKKN
ncbi:hypothetical protein D918_02582 [Trichuris suis]|nr:hypothetical protein D918_02582 [Trichuris suis]